MLKIKQTKDGGLDSPKKEQGDCFRACIASILEVEDIESIPHDLTPGRWLQVMEEYLETQNHSIIALGLEDDIPFISEDIYWIAGVPSLNNNGLHAVVCLGQKIMHDPSNQLTFEIGKNIFSYGPLICIVPIEQNKTSEKSDL